jgi:hypothetical protein
LVVDLVVDKFSASLEDEVGLVEIDLVFDLELVDEGDAFIEMRGFVQVNIDESGQFREPLKAEFIAAVFDGDLLLPFSELLLTVLFDKRDVIEMGRLAEMPLLEEF